jgi:hypothetical protein
MAKWHTETLVFIGNLSHRAVARLECVGPREFFGQGRAPELPNVYDVDAIQWDQFSWDSFLPGLPTGRPSKFSVLPDGRLAFNSVPDAVSMITGFYVKAPQTLSHNDDSPAFPEAFHSAIVYLALQKYAAYEAAPEVYAYAFDRYRYFLQRLERDQLPRITFCGAMA